MLPAGPCKEHRAKEGVWGVIQVLEGRLGYRVVDLKSEMFLDLEHRGLIHPEQPHPVEPLGPMRMLMRVDFYANPPDVLST